MLRVKKLSDNDATKPSEFGPQSVLRDPDRKCGLNSMRLMGILVVFMILLSVLFSVSVVLKDPPSDGVFEASEVRVLEMEPSKGTMGQNIEQPIDKLVGNLLSAGFDERTCLSRYHPIAYHKALAHKPSPYLISRLRSYEALHKRCGVYTESYNKTLEQLNSNHLTSSSSECKYIVWISLSGLGNRILTLASAFLYALLTNRVLLVDPGTDMADLFCEPFPDASWFLPLDFLLRDQFTNFNQESSQCLGKILRTTLNSNEDVFSSFVYIHLVHDYDHHDKLFFCDEEQTHLQKVPWLVMKTDNYFVPSLFLIPSFEEELNNLFPKKDTVFHFLGRYLFHPTNQVWGLVTRYYHAYMAKSSEKIGIQIRVFDAGVGPFQYVLDQILACTLKENLLPEIDRKHPMIIPPSGTARISKSVLLTSLSSGYLEKLRNMYWEHPTVTGEVVGFHQPSHEEHQQTQNMVHNQKAWAEMYLLSLSDVLVTSSWSIFGYVAQGLGGLKPWILYKTENQTAPDPPCRRAMSMEPCFQAPPLYDCKAKTGVDTGVLVPHVRHCEDMSWGLKVVDPHESW